eukprot:gene6283-26545_t
MAESVGRLAETHDKNAALATQHKAEAAAFLARLKALYVEHTGLAGLDNGGNMPLAMNAPPESPAPAPPKAGKNAAVHAPVSTRGEAEKKKSKKKSKEKKRQKKMKVGGAAGAAAAAVSDYSGAKPTKGGRVAQAQSYVDMRFVCKTVYTTVCTFACALLKVLCVTLSVATALLNWFAYFGGFNYVYTVALGIARWHHTVAYVLSIDLASITGFVYILTWKSVALATISRHLSPTTTEYAVYAVALFFFGPQSYEYSENCSWVIQSHWQCRFVDGFVGGKQAT